RQRASALYGPKHRVVERPISGRADEFHRCDFSILSDAEIDLDLQVAAPADPGPAASHLIGDRITISDEFRACQNVAAGSAAGAERSRAGRAKGGGLCLLLQPRLVRSSLLIDQLLLLQFVFKCLLLPPRFEPLAKIGQRGLFPFFVEFFQLRAALRLGPLGGEALFLHFFFAFFLGFFFRFNSFDHLGALFGLRFFYLVHRRLLRFLGFFALFHRRRAFLFRRLRLGLRRGHGFNRSSGAAAELLAAH